MSYYPSSDFEGIKSPSSLVILLKFSDEEYADIIQIFKENMAEKACMNMWIRLFSGGSWDVKRPEFISGFYIARTVSLETE